MDRYVPFILVPVVGWGVRRLLRKRGDWTDYKKRTLGIGIGAFLITELGRSFYRPYVYANDIDDGFVADTLGNSFGTVAAVFMILTLAGKGTAWDWQLVAIVLAGLVGYELLNLAGGHPFDRNDLIATGLFGALSVLIVAGLLRRYGRSAIVA